MIFRFRPRDLFRVMVALAPLIALDVSGARGDAAGQQDMATLVTVDWLSQHLDDPDLVVLDCSVQLVMKEDGGMEAESGRSRYEAGHIPTAGFADLTGELADPDSPLDFVLPDPRRFCEVMGNLGVGDDSRVVLYDGFNSMWATRVWWMLRWVGFDRAAVLDGGSGAWTAAGHEMSSEPATRESRRLTPSVRPEVVAHQSDVRAAIDDDAVMIVDVMPEPHYRGEMALYGRPGHIPTALNIPSMSLFADSGRFRSREELEAMFPADRSAPIITYCGAGIAASASAFVLTRLGFTDVAVYMGSLQEWAANPENPLTVEAARESER
jgi:thiosulfate/3-mercaptopyruvate sulfurtransferase